jgi:hypothetical protein
MMSFLKRLAARFLAFVGRRKYMTEEEALGEEIERLDREDRDWDRDGRIAAASAALESGMRRDLLVRIYGEEIVREAEKERGT